MSLTREDIARVALLARLRLSDAELDEMTHQLADIVKYVESLSEVDTENIEPMAHAVDVANAFRKDIVADSLPREEALANAPSQDGECYLVPAVLGQ